MTAAAFPGSHPDAYVLTGGFRTLLLRIPENAEIWGERFDDTLRGFSPGNGW